MKSDCPYRGDKFYLNNTNYDSFRHKLSYRYQWAREDCEDIRMTVALPLRKMGGISWLALESLRRQEGVDFNWELIIYEDNGESRGVLDKFIGKMPGCKKIIYKSISL